MDAARTELVTSTDSLHIARTENAVLRAENAVLHLKADDLHSQLQQAQQVMATQAAQSHQLLHQITQLQSQLDVTNQRDTHARHTLDLWKPS